MAVSLTGLQPTQKSSPAKSSEGASGKIGAEQQRACMWAAPSHGLVLGKWKGERGLSSSVHFSLLLNCDCLMLLPPYGVTTGCALRLESSRRAFPHTDFVRVAVTALRKVTDGHRTEEGEGKRRMLTSTPRLKAPHSRASFL